MKDKEKLIEAEKELFFSYTGIDVSGIGVEIVDEIKTEHWDNPLASATINDSEKYIVKIEKGYEIASNFSNLTIIWHEFVHCIDIDIYSEIFDIRKKEELFSNKAFTIWTEFHANYISQLLYIKFMKENQGIREKDIKNSLDNVLAYYRKYLKGKYEDTKNTTVYSLLYSYSTFYGQYLAYLEFLNDKMERFPEEFCYDYRISMYMNFLYENKSIPTEIDKWNRLDKIIDKFIRS